MTDDLYKRLRSWSAASGDIRLEQTPEAYELTWRDTSLGVTCFIEIYTSTNGIAARAGVLKGGEHAAIKLEMDKTALSSWHCSPFADLEMTLADLRQAPPRAYTRDSHR